MSNKVLIIGMGEVGRIILEFLARDPKCPELVMGDINEERGQFLTNTAIAQAAAARLYPSITFKKIDLTEVDNTADFIKEITPDVVINSSVMQTWSEVRKLPKDLYEKISSATLGAWIPCQLALPYKLMLSIKKTGLNPHVINTSLPDFVNQILAKVGLAPTIGIGNVENINNGVKIIVSRKLQVPMDIIKIFLICHHVWWVYPREAGIKRGIPFYIKVIVNNKDVTEQFDTEQLLWDSIKLYPPGTEFTTVAASSAILNMYALLSPSGIFTHSPSPKGLPGGYPIILSNKGPELALPEGIKIEEAIEINKKSEKFDGVERIEEDGTVVYMDYTHKILSSMLGFTRKSFNVQESFEVAKELIAKYKAFAAKYI